MRARARVCVCVCVCVCVYTILLKIHNFEELIRSFLVPIKYHKLSELRFIFLTDYNITAGRSVHFFQKQVFGFLPLIELNLKIESMKRARRERYNITQCF